MVIRSLVVQQKPSKPPKVPQDLKTLDPFKISGLEQKMAKSIKKFVTQNPELMERLRNV